MQKLLDGVERVGNKVPHPAVIRLGRSAPARGSLSD